LNETGLERFIIGSELEKVGRVAEEEADPEELTGGVSEDD
jgi:hypothetical protein